jgi:hypothetical protein
MLTVAHCKEQPGRPDSLPHDTPSSFRLSPTWTRRSNTQEADAPSERLDHATKGVCPGAPASSRASSRCVSLYWTTMPTDDYVGPFRKDDHDVLTAVFKSLPVGVVVCDSDGHFVCVSQEAKRILGIGLSRSHNAASRLPGGWWMCVCAAFCCAAYWFHTSLHSYIHVCSRNSVGARTTTFPVRDRYSRIVDAP